jgi:hypothetical protein
VSVRRLWLLLPWVALLSINNLFWAEAHLLRAPPAWDPALYLGLSLRYVHALVDRGLPALLDEVITGSGYWPPLFPLSTLPLYLLLGESRVVAHLTTSLYLLPLLFGVNRFASRLGGEAAGLLAVFLASTFSGLVSFSRDYMLDVPMAAWVTLALYALALTDDFERRGPSLAFGALAGLALLTKTMAGVFLFGPVVYCLGRTLPERTRVRRALANAALAGTAAVLVASIWWGPNLNTALWYMLDYGFGKGAMPYSPTGSEIFSFGNLTFYAEAIANDGTGFLYACLFLALAIGARGGAPRSTTLLWVWLLSGYTILTLVRNKAAERYALSLLPAMAILLSVWITSLIRVRWRRTVTAFAVAIGVLNYAALTFETPFAPPSFGVGPFLVFPSESRHSAGMRELIGTSSPWPVEELVARLTDIGVRVRERAVRAGMDAHRARALPDTGYVRYIYWLVLNRGPDPEGLRRHLDQLRSPGGTREAVFRDVAGSEEFRNRPFTVFLVPDHPFFNPSTLGYYAERVRSPLVFVRDPNPVGEMTLRASGAILVKTGGYQGPDFTTRNVDGIRALLARRDAGFPVTAAFRCPDGSSIEVRLPVGP